MNRLLIQFTLAVVVQIAFMPVYSIGQELLLQKRLQNDISESMRAIQNHAPDSFTILTQVVGQPAQHFYLTTYDMGFTQKKRYKYTWQNFEASDFVTLADRTIIVVGNYHHPDSPSNIDIGIVKIDTLANVIWKKTIGGDQIDGANQVIFNNGSLIIAGESNSGVSGDKTEPSRGRFDLWFLKLDLAGNIISQKTIGGNHDDRSPTFYKRHSNSFFVRCHSLSNKSGDKTVEQLGGGDVWMFELDSDFHIRWQSALGNDLDNTPNKGFIDKGKELVSVSSGRISSTDRDFKVSIFWTDTIGKLIKSKTLDTNGGDAGRSIYKTCDGGYLLTATSMSGLYGDKSEAGYGGRDIWLIRFDKKGNKIWDKTIGGTVSESNPVLLREDKRTYSLIFSSQSPKSGNLTEDNKNHLITPYAIKITDLTIPQKWFFAWLKGCNICTSVSDLINWDIPQITLHPEPEFNAE